MCSARHVALALVLVGGLALAGCTLQPQSSEYPDRSEVRDQLSSLQAIEADVVSETAGPGNETRIRMHVVQNVATGEFRITVEDGPSSGTTMVSNGSTLWYYQPERNVVRVIRGLPSTDRVNTTASMVGSIYDRLEDSEDADGSIGISPAPTVPAGPPETCPSGQSVRLPLGDNATVRDGGTASVDGRETRVVELEAGEGGSLLENATYWIDREWHFPLQSRVHVRIGNETTATTTTYRNVTFNPDVSDVQFSFEPPATATVVEGRNGSFQTYQNRSALVAATDRSIPDPDVPADYSFDSAELAPAGTGQSVAMIYASDSKTLTVSKLAGVESALREDAERIDVAGQEGRLVSVGTNRAIVWTCEGSTYSVRGAGDGVDLRSVAESVACE